MKRRSDREVPESLELLTDTGRFLVRASESMARFERQLQRSRALAREVRQALGRREAGAPVKD